MVIDMTDKNFIERLRTLKLDADNERLEQLADNIALIKNAMEEASKQHRCELRIYADWDGYVTEYGLNKVDMMLVAGLFETEGFEVTPEQTVGRVVKRGESYLKYIISW